VKVSEMYKIAPDAASGLDNSSKHDFEAEDPKPCQTDHYLHMRR